MIIEFSKCQVNTDNIKHLMVVDTIGCVHMVKREDIIELKILDMHPYNDDKDITYILVMKIKLHTNDDQDDPNVLKDKPNPNYNVRSVEGSSKNKEFIQQSYDEINKWINTTIPIDIDVCNENSIGYFTITFGNDNSESSVTINNNDTITIVARGVTYVIPKEKLLDVSTDSKRGNAIKRNIRYGTRIGHVYVGTSDNYYTQGPMLYSLDINCINNYDSFEHIYFYDSNKYKIESARDAIARWKENGFDKSSTPNVDSSGCLGMFLVLLAIIVSICYLF